MTSPLHTAAQRLRDSKARWGSYAIDHDAIDALADLLEAVDPLGYVMGGSKAETLAVTDVWHKARALAAAINGDQP